MFFKDVWKDVQAVKDRDPAARSAFEVLFLYQGVQGGYHRFQDFLR